MAVDVDLRPLNPDLDYIVNLNCSYALFRIPHAKFCVKLAAVSQIRLKALFLLQNVFCVDGHISETGALQTKLIFGDIECRST